jgi:hypothetical protein
MMSRKLSILLLAACLLANSCFDKQAFLHITASATKITGTTDEYEVTCNALGILHERFEKAAGSKDVAMALATADVHLSLVSAPRALGDGAYAFKIRTSLHDQCILNVALVLEDGRLLGPVPTELVLPP